MWSFIHIVGSLPSVSPDVYSDHERDTESVWLLQRGIKQLYIHRIPPTAANPNWCERVKPRSLQTTPDAILLLRIYIEHGDGFGALHINFVCGKCNQTFYGIYDFKESIWERAQNHIDTLTSCLSISMDVSTKLIWIYIEVYTRHIPREGDMF